MMDSASNNAVSAVMTEAYTMLGLTLTVPQARRLANAALDASPQREPESPVGWGGHLPGKIEP